MHGNCTHYKRCCSCNLQKLQEKIIYHSRKWDLPRQPRSEDDLQYALVWLKCAHMLKQNQLTHRRFQKCSPGALLVFNTGYYQGFYFEINWCVSIKSDSKSVVLHCYVGNEDSDIYWIYRTMILTLEKWKNMKYAKEPVWYKEQSNSTLELDCVLFPKKQNYWKFKMQ